MRSTVSVDCFWLANPLPFASPSPPSPCASHSTGCPTNLLSPFYTPPIAHLLFPCRPPSLQLAIQTVGKARLQVSIKETECRGVKESRLAAELNKLWPGPSVSVSGSSFLVPCSIRGTRGQARRSRNRTSLQHTRVFVVHHVASIVTIPHAVLPLTSCMSAALSCPLQSDHLQKTLKPIAHMILQSFTELFSLQVLGR